MTTQFRELEIPQEARFVLWALRCAVLCSYGDADAEAEIARGFQIVKVLDTSPEFWSFANALVAVSWSPAVWHGPHCCCASNEELLVLQALSESAERLRSGQAEPACLWRTLIPAASAGIIDATARSWIAALDQAGVMFPRRSELIENSGPLQTLMEPVGAARLH